MAIVIEPGALNTSGINILHQNRFTSGTVTWSSETVGGEGINAIDQETWNSWRSSSVPATQTLDYGSAIECNGACIAAHDGYVAGSTYLIQYSTDNVSWTTASSYAPLTAETIFMIFPEVAARYWRLRINNAVSSVGVVMIGNRLTFQNGPVSGYKPFNHSWESEMLTNMSDGGQSLGNRVISTGAEFSVNVGSVDRDFSENSGMFLQFERVFNRGGTFAYCSSPDYAPKDCAYCWRSGGPLNVTWVEGSYLSDVSFDARGYVHV